MKPDVAEQLRSLPDLEPPANVWRCIARLEARRKWLRRGGGFAVAASVLIAVAVGTLYFNGPETMIDASPNAPAMAEPMIVSGPARPYRSGSAEQDVDPGLLALQRQSREMERLINSMPRQGRVVQADTAGVIAELEDRIAAVDYQLNRLGLNRAGSNRVGSGRSGFDRRQYQARPEPDLWRRRVEYMDQLVRARYVEADVQGY